MNTTLNVEDLTIDYSDIVRYLPCNISGASMLYDDFRDYFGNGTEGIWHKEVNPYQRFSESQDGVLLTKEQAIYKLHELLRVAEMTLVNGNIIDYCNLTNKGLFSQKNQSVIARFDMSRGNNTIKNEDTKARADWRQYIGLVIIPERFLIGSKKKQKEITGKFARLSIKNFNSTCDSAIIIR